jgi:hypothetical protein
MPMQPAPSRRIRHWRALCGLLVLLLSCGAAQAEAPAETKMSMPDMLAWFAQAHAAEEKTLVCARDCFVACENGAGFAFRIPKGMRVEANDWGTAVLLLSENKEGFRASISVAVVPADERLAALTREEAEAAYRSRLEDFSLAHFARETMHGEPGLRLVFLTGTSPRLLCEQRIFVAGDCSFVITLTMAYAPSAVCRAAAQFAAFWDTLVLYTPGTK